MSTCGSGIALGWCGGRGDDVGGAVTVGDGEGEVAHGGHDRRAVSSADLALLFGEG